MAAKYYKKTKKCNKEKLVKTIKIFLKKKNKKCEYAHIQYRKLFIENELSEEKEKIKIVNLLAIYIIIFVDKKRQKG